METKAQRMFAKIVLNKIQMNWRGAFGEWETKL